MKEKLRLAIINAYGIDIDKHKYEFTTSLNAYILNVDNFTIRVSVDDEINDDMKLARLQWALDLKSMKNTICEPIKSINGNYFEHAKIGNWMLTISMFRTARGRIMTPDNITPMFFISAGDMLGTMHNMSVDRGDSDKAYDIPDAALVYGAKHRAFSSMIKPSLNDRVMQIVSQVSKVPQTNETYGVCYGEFDLHNIIVDTNNIHLFDFNRSIYGHYLYDVASFAVSILSAGYMPGVDAKEIIDRYFLPWFRIGYSINKHCDNHTFDDLELFMALRGCWLLVNLIEKYQKEQLPEIKLQIDFVSAILAGEDIFDGIDKARGYFFKK